MTMRCEYRTALITGASSGIGETFARVLAARGVALFLTCAPADQARLEALAAELHVSTGAPVECAAVDLLQRDAAEQVQALAGARGIDPHLLVNNAGIGTLGAFGDTSLEKQLAMVRINIEALVALTGVYLPWMRRRRFGGIVNIASTAAFQPVPYFAVYAASKAFVLSFSEALWTEMHGYNVRVVGVCPGPVADTGFNPAVGKTPRGLRGHLERRYMARDAVVRAALTALDRDQPVSVVRMPLVGLGYYPAAFAAQLVPRRLRLLIGERVAHWYFRSALAADSPPALR